VIGGLVLAVCAAACFEGGYVLQAREARAPPAGPSRPFAALGALARRRVWLAGIALSALGVGLQAGGLLVAPLSVVQPALALGLVLLLALARGVLGERVRHREVSGSALIGAGVTIVALCAPARHAGGGGPVAVAVVMTGLGAAALGPHVLRQAPAGLAVAGTAAAEVWAAVGLKLATDALSSGRGLEALAWAAGCAAAAALALAAEMSALRRIAAVRVGPIVLAAQAAVPVVLAPLVAGERWTDTPGGGLGLAAGVVAVATGATILGASRSVSDMLLARRDEAPEHDVGRVGQRGE